MNIIHYEYALTKQSPCCLMSRMCRYALSFSLLLASASKCNTTLPPIPFSIFHTVAYTTHNTHTIKDSHNVCDIIDIAIWFSLPIYEKKTQHSVWHWHEYAVVITLGFLFCRQMIHDDDYGMRLRCEEYISWMLCAGWCVYVDSYKKKSRGINVYFFLFNVRNYVHRYRLNEIEVARI